MYLQVSSPCSKRLTFLLIREMTVIYFLRDLTAHMKTAGLFFFSLAPTFYVNFYFWIILEKFWRRQWQPTPVLLPGKSHGWRSHTLLRIYHKCWIWSNAFSASIEMIICFFILFMWCSTLILWIWNHLCIWRISPLRLWWMALLICCWIQFASTLLKIVTFIFIRNIGL